MNNKNKIWMGHHPFDVQWYDRADEHSRNQYGYCNREDKVIGVSESQTPSQKIETLIHEIVHAGIWVLGDAGKEMKEEDYVCKCASVVAMALVQNKWILPWIEDNLKKIH